MYTQLIYKLTSSVTKIEIDWYFTSIFMKICKNGIEATDIDFSKSTLKIGDDLFDVPFERYNLVNAWAGLDHIYENLLYAKGEYDCPKLQFNLHSNEKSAYELYVVIMTEPYFDILCDERKSGIRNIGTLTWMCSDSRYIEAETTDAEMKKLVSSLKA